jgi:hypothetical protein
MRRRLIAASAVMIATGTLLVAQETRIASPEGSAATEIRGKYRSGSEAVYEGGHWIEITYSRPIKRGRELWGAGPDYGKQLSAGAPVWRAGANMSTRLKTDLPLVVNGKPVKAGEYSLFIDLKPNNWTLIVSSWGARKEFDKDDGQTLFGSFDYTPDKDVVRAPMKLETLPRSVDQLTWQFLDMSDAGGLMAIEWDKTRASVPFRAGG